MDVRDIPAVDVHAHYGTCMFGEEGIVADSSRGDVNEVVRRARRANIQLSMVSPLAGLWPRGHADPVAANQQALLDLADNQEAMQWVVVHPLQEDTYRQAEQMLALPQCAGIKIHPEDHCYHIADHGRQLFDFAAKHRAIVLTHSGQENSKPEDFMPFVNDNPEVTLILGHIGCTFDDVYTRQVEAVKARKYDNVFADTSSAKNIFPGLIEWAVAEIGADRILFGTDSPLYFVPLQRARIDSAEIADDDKKMILRDNAVKLFGLDLNY